MKIFFTILFSLLAALSFSQAVNERKAAIKTITKITKAYSESCENTESNKNKIAFTKAIRLLRSVTKEEELLILIDAWMYYDPTDFPTRKLIEPVLFANKTVSLKAVIKRLKNKTEWEDDYTAPYSDLLMLKTELTK